jgi:hypothetical protein
MWAGRNRDEYSALELLDKAAGHFRIAMTLDAETTSTSCTITGSAVYIIHWK